MENTNVDKNLNNINKNNLNNYNIDCIDSNKEKDLKANKDYSNNFDKNTTNNNYSNNNNNNNNIEQNININTNKENIVSKNKKRADFLSLIKIFCRQTENNINNSNINNSNINGKGIKLEIVSVNGIQKLNLNCSNTYIRFYISFFNDKSEFIGSTTKTKLYSITTSDKNYLEITNKEPLSFYFFNSEYVGKVIAVIEVVLVQLNKYETITRQTTEGWGYFNIDDKYLKDDSKKYFNLFSQTPRNLKFLDRTPLIEGASISYKITFCSSIDSCSNLLPCFIALQGLDYNVNSNSSDSSPLAYPGTSNILPGLIKGFFPLNISDKNLVETKEFKDIYLKNIEMELPESIESEIAKFSENYFINKIKESNNSSNLNNLKVNIKERKLRAYIHNTWKTINSAGIENCLALQLKNNTLISNSVLCIDNYFDEETPNKKCGVIFEVYYVIENNINDNKITLTICYGVFVPDVLTNDNAYSSIYMINKGKTLSGDNVFINNKKSVPVKFNFILSLNKISYDKTYKEEEIKVLKDSISELRQQLAIEMKKNFDVFKQNSNEFNKKEEEFKFNLEEKIRYLEGKLVKNQNNLKEIYNKEDKNSGFIIDSSSKHLLSNNKNYNYSKNIKENDVKEIKTLNNNNNNNFKQNVNNNIFREETMKETNLQPENSIGLNNNNNINNYNNNSNYNINNATNNDVDANASKNDNNKKLLHDKNSKLENTSYNNNFNSQVKHNLYNNNFQDNNFYDKSILKNNNINSNIHKSNNNASYDINNFSGNASEILSSNVLDNLDLNNPAIKQLLSALLSTKLSKNSYSPDKITYDNINRNKYYDIEPRDISRKDRAELQSKGILSLIPQDYSESATQYTIEQELKNSKIACNITINFVAYKPSENILKNITNEEIKYLSFKVNFWYYTNKFTEPALINKPENKIYSSSYPFALVKENYIDDKSIKLKFNIDPNNDKHFDYKDYISYLMHKNLFVEVYNFEKLFLLGYLKIPLVNFLRNEKSDKLIQKEYELYDYFNHKTKGCIIVNTSVCGYTVNFNYDPNEYKQVYINNCNIKNNKKKKVSIRPMNVDDLTLEEKNLLGKDILEKNNIKSYNDYKNIENNQSRIIKLNIDPETQKKMRVLKYTNLIHKKEKYYNSDNPYTEYVSNEITNKINQEKLRELKNKQEKEDKYFSALDLAHRIKEIKKNNLIKQTMEENRKNSFSISLIAGKPHYINYIIKNDSEVDENFHIIITSNTDDKSKNNDITPILSENSVKVISDPIYWKNIVEKEKGSLIPPHNGDYNCISDDNYFILKSQEKMPLLLKLLTYDIKKSNNYLIWIYKGKEPVEYLNIIIDNVLDIVDHNFEFNVPDNRTSLLTIPNPFKHYSSSYNNNDYHLTSNTNDISHNLKIFEKTDNTFNLDNIVKNQICTHYGYKLSINSENKDFNLQYKPKEYNDNKEITFKIYLYLDTYKSNFIACWRIIIRSHETIDIQTQLGSKVIQKFSIESNERRSINCYSNNNELVYLSEKYSKPFILLPDISNEVKFIVYPKKKDSLNEVLINCVDINTRELLKTVLVRIFPENPIFNHVYRIDCNIGNSTHFKYEYTSKLPKWSVIKFESNNDNYLKVILNIIINLYIIDY